MATATRNGQRKTATKNAGDSKGDKVSRAPRNPRATGGAAKESQEATMAKKSGTAVEDKGRQQALERAITQIDKMFGQGAIMRLSSDETVTMPCVSTGSISLDLALGGRGMPKSRVVEIFGPESSGKTTLALTVVAHAQGDGGTRRVRYGATASGQRLRRERGRGVCGRCRIGGDAFGK